MPQVRARNVDGGHQDQSVHETLPKLPFRMVVAGPSGCGKTELVVSAILDLYKTAKGRSPWQRVFVFSPSVHVDRCWEPVKAFVRDKLKVDTEKEPCFFDTFDRAALHEMLAVQKRVVMKQRERGDKKMFGVLLVIDDFADDISVIRNSPLLWETYVRGRHSFVSTIIATQKLRALAPIIRVNATHMIIFRFRSNMELKAMLEENSAVFGEQVLLEMYREATKEPYGFLLLNLNAKDVHEFAYAGFDRRLYDEFFQEPAQT